MRQSLACVYAGNVFVNEIPPDPVWLRVDHISGRPRRRRRKTEDGVATPPANKVLRADSQFYVEV
jgi:hypothetical protein